MNAQTLALSTYELVMALIFGVMSVLITLFIVNRILLKMKAGEAIQKGGVSMAIFQGGLIVAVLLLASSSIEPSVDALRTMIYVHNAFHYEMLWIASGYFILFYAMSLIFSFLLLIILFYSFVKFTHALNEIEEIKNGNTAVSLLLILIMLGSVVFMRAPVKNFLVSLIDYEALELRALEEYAPTEDQPRKIIPKEFNPPDSEK